jgi:hypothetical protein
MKTACHISLFLILMLAHSSAKSQDSLAFRGQISAWGNFNYTNEIFILGGRYIPQLNYSKNLNETNILDLEISGNIYGSWQSDITSGKMKPYRAWVRYSTRQFELRAGLQKINFGSANILRPLMWFDQVDPRDPLQLTDGVWGVLGRYFFLNNANIWLWGLYGNHSTKGWEITTTNKTYPEFGGRIQVPVPLGEAALSFHHRRVDTRNMALILPAYPGMPENRLGFDIKIDWLAGMWFEGVWISNGENLGPLTNQAILNAGADYTFGLGNGLLLIYEHLIVSSDEKPFEFANKLNFSVLSASYPIGLFDNLNALLYYSWDHEQVYTFLNWQRQYNKISLHFMAYWNPETFNLPQQNIQSNLFGGKGFQVMFVFNH